MAPTQTISGAVRAPLDEALEGEIRKLDLVLARMWQVLAGLGIPFGLYVYWGLGLPQGLAAAELCAVGVLWFTVHLVWLKRRSARIAVLINAVFEATLPSMFLLLIGYTQGSAYALGSYVSPLIFTAMILAATARLRPNATIIVGTFHGVAFLAIYFFYLRGRLSPEDALKPLMQPSLQVTRALSFAVGGAIGFAVTHALRRAIGRAERNVRSNDLFGKYRLCEKLGAGGMGVVHRAVYCPEGGFERTVAVKLLHRHLADQASFIQAFREEAELSARLAHPNVVQVLDFGRFEDAYFLAMEHVDGATLAALLRKMVAAQRPVSPTCVAWIGQQLLSGLAYSHAGARDAHGGVLHVVHRDLCPANVLVSSSGEVKISDFGVAKALRDATFSETKTVVGHVGYMSPEQVCADPIDERTDLFAAGVILWEVLATRPLFRRESEALSLMALMHRDVPLVSSLRDDLDAGWDAFFDSALAERPNARFASASEMSAALEVLCPTTLPGRDELAALVDWASAAPSAPVSVDGTLVETRPTEVARAQTGRGQTVKLTPSEVDGSRTRPSD